MAQSMPIAAFLYDFDKTLCTTDMQDYSFIPSLGLTPAEFWRRVDHFGRENRMDGILAYMYMMIRESARAGRPVCVYAQIRRRDVQLHILRLRKHRHRGG